LEICWMVMDFKTLNTSYKKTLQMEGLLLYILVKINKTGAFLIDFSTLTGFRI